MSKFELQRITQELSGVSHDEAHEVLNNNIYSNLFDRIGCEKGCLELSQLFYDHVFSDNENPWFLGIFASSTKKEAVDNQYRFFVETFGGPPLYRQTKGKYTRLVGRHANYSIHVKAARRWTDHMCLALEKHSQLKNDEEIRIRLGRYFRYTAHYIVAASEYMRPDQLSGGLIVDNGRVW